MSRRGGVIYNDVDDSHCYALKLLNAFKSRKLHLRLAFSPYRT